MGGESRDPGETQRHRLAGSFASHGQVDETSTLLIEHIGTSWPLHKECGHSCPHCPWEVKAGTQERRNGISWPALSLLMGRWTRMSTLLIGRSGFSWPALSSRMGRWTRRPPSLLRHQASWSAAPAVRRRCLRKAPDPIKQPRASRLAGSGIALRPVRPMLSIRPFGAPSKRNSIHCPAVNVIPTRLAAKSL